MENKPNLSERTQEVLDIIIDHPGKTPVDIAAIGGIALGQVTGAITSLKKNGMLEIEDGKYTATMEAEFEFGKANDVPAPASAKKALATSVAAAAATDSADADADAEEDAVLAQVAASMTAAAAAETVIADAGNDESDTPAVEAATETAAPAAVAATETVAETEAAEEPEAPQVMSTLIPGRVPASVKPAAEAKPATESKASKARAIFEEMKDRPRKEIMARLMTEVGLTMHGANTYLYNFRKAAGMVKARDAAPVGEATAVAETTALAAGEEPAFVPEAVENVVIDVTAQEAEAPAPVEAETVAEVEEAKIAE